MSWSHYYDTIVPCRQPPVETLSEGTLHLRCPACGMERSCPRSEWLRTHAGPLGASAGISWRRFAVDAFKAGHVLQRCRALRAQGHIF